MPNCNGSWLGGNQTFLVGTPATFGVTLRDKYNNLLSSSYSNMTFFDLVPKVFKLGTHTLVNINAIFMPSNDSSILGYLLVFNVSEPGNYNMYVESDSVGIWGSPFAFTAMTGTLC